VVNAAPIRRRRLPLMHPDVHSAPKSNKDFHVACANPQSTSVKSDLIATLNGSGATRDNTR